MCLLKVLGKCFSKMVPEILISFLNVNSLSNLLLLCLYRDDDGFVIPELPYGRELVINIRSTWGDKHYVGLTGVEVFASSGEQINITKVSTASWIA